MRLTLRTLLAYLDDVLEPEQAKEIGEKIAQSDFASTLSNRIKDVLRRRRITAPDLDGAGMGVDPNTVAEYLDNTLPPDAVADVERIFLESDMHLAEVAAAHQILTLVLGEPVTISEESRERMYALGPETKHDSKLIDSMNGNARQAEPKAEKSEPVGSQEGEFADRIPAYLRRKPLWKRAFPWVLVAVLAVAFGIAIYSDPTLFGGGQPEDNDNKVAKNDDPKTTPGTPQRKTSPVKKTTGIKVPPAPVKVAKIDPNKKGVLPKVPVGVNGKPPKDVPEKTGAKTSGKKSIVGKKPPIPVGSGKKGKVVVAKPPKTVAGKSPKMQYISPAGDGLTWRFDAKTKDWTALKNNQAVNPGERLATPLPFSGRLVIADGRVGVEMKRGTLVELLPASNVALFGFDLQRGRIIVKPGKGMAGDKFTGMVFALGIHGRTYRVELLTPETLCGIEVAPAYPNTYEQKTESPLYTSSLIVPKGSVRIANAAGEIVVVSATADTAGKASLTPPAGVATDVKVNIVTDQIKEGVWPSAAKTTSVTETKFAGYFLKDLDADMQGNISLLNNAPDIVRDRRAYVSQYAVESLAVIGDAGELVRALSIANHEESRTAAIAGLRSWLALHPKDGKLLQTELRKRFTKDDSVAVYRLLWGFGEADARDYTTSVQLVRWMDHDHIAVRELAFMHVKRLTGFQYNYQPNLRGNLRMLAIKRWAMHLEKNEGLLPPKKKMPAKKPKKS